MTKGKCKKHFPKKFVNETTVDEEGYLVYRKRDTGAYVEKKGVKLNNLFVVPSNRNLLVKFDSHMNIEICNQHRSIKYLFKYVNKGPNRITVFVEVDNNNQLNSESLNVDKWMKYKLILVAGMLSNE